MSNSIFEEEGKKPAAGGMATAQQQIEKQARQLAYDTRYQVKKEVGGKAVPPAAMKRLLLQRLQKSTAAPNVKVRAKQMLLGEDYIGDVADFAAGTVANAMFKVFVENKNVFEEKVSNSIEEAYLSEMERRGGEKYKVRVTDPKTGNSYIRYATTEKITQLRLKGLRVEKTEHGSTREDEARRGAQTARALGGGGKAKRDYDGDGKVESSSKEHAGVVHNAIQRATGGKPDGKDTRKTVSASYEPKGNVLDEAGGRHGGGSMVGKPGGPPPRNPKPVAKKTVEEAHKPKKGKKGDGNLANNYPPYGKVTRGDIIAGALGKDQKGGKAKVKEDFIIDAAGEDSNTKKIDVMPKGKTNRVSVFPNDGTTDRQGTGAATPRSVYAHTELEGEVLVEKAKSKAQQKFFGMVYAAKKGETPASPEVAKAAKGVSKKEAKKFAKTKHKGLPEKVKVKEAVEPRSGGSSPTLPAAEKFIDELPQKLQQIFGAKTKPTKPVKEESECGCEDEKPKTDRGEMYVDDPRAMKTKINLAKNKLRSMGLKMDYEPEGEMVDEARAEERRGLGSTGAQRQRQKSGEEGPRGRRPVTSYSGGQNPHLRGKGGTTKEQRRESSRRYVDQPGGTYGGPENKQGKGRYAEMQARKRPDLGSRLD